MTGARFFGLTVEPIPYYPHLQPTAIPGAGFEAFKEGVNSAPRGSSVRTMYFLSVCCCCRTLTVRPRQVLLHASHHNGNGGVDMTQNQWQTIFECASQRQLVVILDASFIGYGSTIESDTFPIRASIQMTNEGRLPMLFLCASFSKVRNVFVHLSRVCAANALGATGYGALWGASRSTCDMHSGCKHYNRRLRIGSAYRSCYILLSSLFWCR